jgi:hypothetical protein
MGESARRIWQHIGRAGPGEATGYLLTRPYGGCYRSPTLRKRPIYPDLSDITWVSGHDRRYHQAQRVKTHSAQAERLGVKVLEAEGCSGSCHGILPGLEPGPFAKLV